jgi:hypothetical protein
MPLKKALFLAALAAQVNSFADRNVHIVDVPDYAWHVGCFGTASGNLMGYWDRHGFPNFYAGPTAAGVAPLDSNGSNVGIRSLWASHAGFDGRPADQPGHIEDYWEYYVGDVAYSYESTAIDPYVLAGRAEHPPDSICDFMGSSKNGFTDFDGECAGNIDAFTYNFWEKQGARRVNFTPPNNLPDIQSGWRSWTEWRGNKADTFSQLVDFNPNTPAGTGFTFEDMKAEIDAGYPVMLFLQNPNEFSRSLQKPVLMPRANPVVHGMIAYGYVELDSGLKKVRYRTSWASGDLSFGDWHADHIFEGILKLRGVIGYRPLPQIKSVTPNAEGLEVKWDGPSSILRDTGAGADIPVHWYVVDKATTLAPSSFTAVTEPSTNLQANIPAPTDPNTFYRVRLVDPPSP